MAEDLDFRIRARWSGSGRSGTGTISSGGQSIAYSAPAAMGGRGTGTSPEELLIAAVGSCYSGTLARILQQRGLPADRLDLGARGVVTGYPGDTRFARIVVEPSIEGGDASRLQEYQEAAEAARRRCFIGGTLKETIEYTVGEVRVS